MKVSILMANYNHGKYLRDSIESVLEQTYGNMEFVIVDDGSTDDSVEIINEFKNKDERIKLLCKNQNEGFTSSFKTCYALATGEIIFGLASDDCIVDDTFIHAAVDKFTQYPEIGLVWAKTSLFWDDDEFFTTLGESEYPVFFNGSDFLKSFLNKKSFVAGYSAVFRKSCLDAVGGFAFDLGPQCDYFPNHAVPSKFGGAFIDEIMTHATVFKNKSNFSVDTTEKDRVWRHCQFEKRMRCLGVSHIPEDLWKSWRNALIKDIAPENPALAHELFCKEIQ